MILISLDPGTSTGYAELIADGHAYRLLRVETMKMHAALLCIDQMRTQAHLCVVFEDARLRKWFGGADARQARSGAGIREGVGSIKRDCSIWAEYLADVGLPHLAVKPRAGATKWSAEQLETVTGWKGRTSEHARDAAALAWINRHYLKALIKTP